MNLSNYNDISPQRHSLLLNNLGTSQTIYQTQLENEIAELDNRLSMKDRIIQENNINPSDKVNSPYKTMMNELRSKYQNDQLTDSCSYTCDLCILS